MPVKNLQKFEVNETSSEVQEDQDWNETVLESRIEEELSGRDRALKVIVLAAFARSGSTYLARLLASAPSSSYWHEPLRFGI